MLLFVDIVVQMREDIYVCLCRVLRVVGIPSICGDEDIQAATKEHHEDHQDITAPTQNAGHAHTHSHHIHKHIWILLFSCEL